MLTFLLGQNRFDKENFGVCRILLQQAKKSSSKCIVYGQF